MSPRRIDQERCAKCGKRVELEDLMVYEGRSYHGKCLPKGPDRGNKEQGEGAKNYEELI